MSQEPLKLDCIAVAALMLIALAGCWHSKEESDAKNPVRSNDGQRITKLDDAPKAKDSEASQPILATDKVNKLLREDSFCRDVLAGMSIQEFLRKTPSAKLDKTLSQPEIGYQVYTEFVFIYDFLDGRLISIRHVVPRIQEGANEWVQPYIDALGAPSKTSIPEQYRQLGATRFMSWLLLDHDIGIVFVFHPPTLAPSGVDLFGQYMNTEKWQELEERSLGGNAKPKGQISTPTSESRANKALRELKADSEWGQVAAKIEKLCRAELTPDEVRHEILKTKNLAIQGRFSPIFTLKLLDQAEQEAKRLGLSLTYAVRSSQQSMAAFGSE